METVNETVETVARLPKVDLSRILATLVVFAIALALSGCPSAEQHPNQPTSGHEAVSSAKPAAKQTELKPEPKSEAKAETPVQAKSPEDELTRDITELSKKPRDLGQPLVEHPEQLVRLAPEQPVWIDRQDKHVVLLGEVCRAGYPLEFFATYANRSYEAVVAVNVTPRIVHAALVAVGAVAGRPVQFQPEFVPPSGTEVAIEVRWKDADGKVQSAPAQHWIRNIQTKKELDTNWVFAGSISVPDERTGRENYLADSGELICVLNLPTAMLDLPIRSYAALESRLFEAFEEHLPPPGTPTTLVLKPILPKEPVEPGLHSSSGGQP